jgi:peptide/nickel transport system permease protein
VSNENDEQRLDSDNEPSEPFEPAAGEAGAAADGDANDANDTEVTAADDGAATAAADAGFALPTKPVNTSPDWSPDSVLIGHRSTGREIWSRFSQDKFAVVGMAVILLLVIVAVGAPWIAPHNPNTQYNAGLTNQGMPVGSSWKFPLGTDTLGRDLLSRIIYGARVSLVIGILANGFALLLGVIFGLTAGFFRGWVETLVMRATDVMMAFPIYLFAVALVSVLKPSLWILVLVIGLSYWTPMTRVIHGEVLSIREKECVDAARLIGCTNRRILYRHILPHLVPVIIVYTSLGIATTVLFEATLSFIGLGVQPPTPSWGQMISTAQNYYLSAPQLIIYPGLAIMVTVLAFNLVGDGLRDAFDPQQRRR